MVAEPRTVVPLVLADHAWFCQKVHWLRSIPPTTPEVGVVETRSWRPLTLFDTVPSPYTPWLSPFMKESSAFIIRDSNRSIMASSKFVICVGFLSNTSTSHLVVQHISSGSLFALRRLSCHGIT